MQTKMHQAIIQMQTIQTTTQTTTQTTMQTKMLAKMQTTMQTRIQAATQIKTLAVQTQTTDTKKRKRLKKDCTFCAIFFVDSHFCST